MAKPKLMKNQDVWNKELVEEIWKFWYYLVLL